MKGDYLTDITCKDADFDLSKPYEISYVVKKRKTGSELFNFSDPYLDIVKIHLKEYNKWYFIQCMKDGDTVTVKVNGKQVYPEKQERKKDKGHSCIQVYLRKYGHKRTWH